MIIPMMFTCARIFIAPFLFQAIANHAWYVAAFLFFIGALTDYLDGFFARYLKQESLLGAALDPIADKIFLITALYAVSLQVSYIPWFYVACMIAKELILVIGAGILLCVIPGFTIKPLWSAKVVTACQSVALFIMIFAQMQTFLISENVLAWMVYGCLIASLYVLVEYSFKIYRQLRDRHAL